MASHGRNIRRDAAIARQASQHHRNVSRQELLALGLDDHGIARRAWLFRTYSGVYTVGGPPRTGLEHAAAALLTCRDDAAISHGSAMTLWSMWKRWELPIHVTVPGDRRPSGIKVHQLRGLIDRDIRVHQGLLAASPARTLLDMAPTMADKTLRRRVNDARRARLLALSDVADVVRRFPYHPGARRLKPLLTVKGGPTRSEWEDAFPAFCKEYGLPEPVMSTRVAGYEADALFPDERVVIELDSWKFHSDAESFESDRDRDVDRLVAGFWTVRISWERMRYRSAREADRLHEVLRHRRLASDVAATPPPSRTEPPRSTASPDTPGAHRRVRYRPAR
jgi:hypothetical protein